MMSKALSWKSLANCGLVFGLVLLQGACSTLAPAIPTSSSPQAPQAGIESPGVEQVGGFVSGKFAMTVVDATNTAKDHLTGQFELRYMGSEWHLLFMDPLGNTVAQISTTPTMTVIERQAKERWQEATLDDAVAQALGGQRFPAQALLSWIINGPHTEAPKIAGWQISVKGRNNQGAPRQLDGYHYLNQESNEIIKLRLVINQ